MAVYRALDKSYGFTQPDPTFNKLAEIDFAVDPSTTADGSGVVKIILEPRVWEFLLRGLAKEHARREFGF